MGSANLRIALSTSVDGHAESFRPKLRINLYAKPVTKARTLPTDVPESPA
jgi:hypothetical protein